MGEFCKTIQKLTQQINTLDKALSEKYKYYPKSSVIYHRYDMTPNINWQLYFTIVSNSNIEKYWETIKNKYILKLNASREYVFEILKMKSQKLNYIRMKYLIN